METAHYRAPAEGDKPSSAGPTRRGDEPPGGVPSRARAALLTLLFCSGLGHFYLGHRQRAVLWAAVPPVLFGLSCVMLPHLSAQTGYRVFLSSVLALLSTRALALIDILRLPLREIERAPIWHLFAFWGASLVYGVAGSLFLRTLVVEAFKVPSGSMLPSVQLDDHLLIDHTAFRSGPPKRGEIAVFEDPQQPNLVFVKRVIGLPGDRVDVRDGHAIVNGWAVPHCTLADDAPLPSSEAHGEGGLPRGRIDVEFLGDESYLVEVEAHSDAANGPWTVASGEYFVVGDNRMNSADSRSWFGGRGGGVPFANSIGRPLFVWLAFAPDGKVDWQRMGQSVQGTHLPTLLQALAPALADCLRRRPAQTEPPS